jgi:hypothetical protein
MVLAELIQEKLLTSAAGYDATVDFDIQQHVIKYHRGSVRLNTQTVIFFSLIIKFSFKATLFF